MPLIHVSPISMEALNYNIDDDLIFTSAHSTIRRDSDLGDITILGGDDASSGGIIKVWGSNGGGSLGSLVRVGFTFEGLTGAYPVYLQSFYGVPMFMLTCVMNMGGNKITALADPTNATDAANKQYSDGLITDLLGNPIEFDGSVIYRGADNTGYILIRGGENAAGKGGRIIAHGVDASTYTGGVRLTVPNAASSADLEVITIIGKTDTPVIKCNSRRITDIAAPTTNGDALIYDAWAAWTPTLTWSSTEPSGTRTMEARECLIGKVQHCYFFVRDSDSNGSSLTSFTLPRAGITGQYHYVFGRERAGAAGTTKISVGGYVDTNTGNFVLDMGNTAGTDTKQIEYFFSFSYEVA